MLPSLQKATNSNAIVMDAVMGAEDFSFFAAKLPSLFFYLGGMTPGTDPKQTAAHHTPDFYIDESGMKTGIKAFCFLVLDYMKMAQTKSLSKQKSF
jgi:amidohydrolase